MRLSSNGRRGIAAAVVALIIAVAVHLFTGSATATPTHPNAPEKNPDTKVVIHWCDAAPIVDGAVRLPPTGNCYGKWAQADLDGARQELHDANSALNVLLGRYAEAKKLASRVNRLNSPANYEKGLAQIEELQRLYREFRDEHNSLIEALRARNVNLGSATRLAPETLEMHFYGLE